MGADDLYWERREGAKAERVAFEIVGEVKAAAPIVFTCEHATRELPGLCGDPEDEPFLDDHWGFDIGAADLTRALARDLDCPAVLSGFSRLVCDPNRDPAEPSFVVEQIAGHRLVLNRGVDEAERQRRRERFFDPYHDAIDRVLSDRIALDRPVWLCSIHSFTPVYLGRSRPMEVGVLFDAHDEQALTLQEALSVEGFETVLNAPYSGKDGLIYAARRHGRAHGIVYLELEVRQDLIETPPLAEAVAARIGRALRVVDPSDLSGAD